MNKAKQPDVKKTLVRNPEQLAPKTVTVTQSKDSVKSKTDSTALSNKTSKTGPSRERVALKTRFNTPEFHTTLKLSKKIDEVIHPRKTKSLSDVDKNKLAIDEQVTRKVNFPYGQPVFKDLIPLTNNEVKLQPVMTSRGPILPKDKEPIFSDFLAPTKSKIYYHLPSCGAKNFDESRISTSACDSLNLYKTIQINSEKM